MKILLVMISSLLLTACASAPVQIKDSIPTHKLIRYPEVGQDKTVKADEALYIFLDYQSNFPVFVEEPLTAKVALGRVNIMVTEPLYMSIVEGKEMYCSRTNTWSDLLLGPVKPSCGIDSTKTGYFDMVAVAPGAFWFENKLNKKIKYREVENASNPQGPLKRELIFNTFESNMLFVTYREFRQSLATPSTITPLSIKLNDLATPIEIKGLRLQIKDAAATHLSYQVLVPWESTLKPAQR
jgi:hypothetical protein